MKPTTILEWETELSPSGKDKDSITTQLAMQSMEMLMSFKISIIQLILKVFGHLSTIHTVMTRQELLVSLSMEMMKLNQSDTMSLTQEQNVLNSF
jgi:hypothetical protein